MGGRKVKEPREQGMGRDSDGVGQGYRLGVFIHPKVILMCNEG